ncbi:hypothetical protein [Alteribacter lacisalsi]|nr:hypothetical protein [Alteribacter lacisalsi]
MIRILAAGAGVGLTVYVAGVLLDYRDGRRIEEERRAAGSRHRRS